MPATAQHVTAEAAPLPLSSESETAALASEVERLKEELELVSYLTSHDLQAPLRTIFFNCEALAEHLSLSKDPEANKALIALTREAKRMKTLMEGLLDYLRLETFVPAHKLVDSNEVVAAAMATVEDKIRATNAQITYGTLPTVYGHRGRLTRLFSNLFDNALKFNTASPPVVNVSARKTGDGYEFCVEDNGIGIDEEYHNIIFGLFQRLHPAEDYPGNGTGLALARKIVESHGGKIWVNSAPDKGSRFFFTLAAQA